jgi:D-tyrosyl-tRNA(Tyr) deacylase
MRALVQRVIRAEVRAVIRAGNQAGVDGDDFGSEHLDTAHFDSAGSEFAGPEFAVVGRIGSGFCVLLGVTHTDTEATATKMADKIWHLRILNDAEGVMNLSPAQLAEQQGSAPTAIMVISQFTLYGDTGRGRRPSWIEAARPEVAEPLVDQVVAELRKRGAQVATGVFRTEMQVELVNDGPVTVMIEI